MSTSPFPPPRLPGHQPDPAAVPSPPAPTRRSVPRVAWMTGGVACVLVVAAIASLVVLGGGRDPGLIWEQAWTRQLSDRDALAASELVWADDDVAVLFVDDEASTLVVLDRASGDELWSHPIVRAERGPDVFRAGDVIVVIEAQPDTLGLVAASGFDVGDGARRWRVADAGEVTPAGGRLVMSRVHGASSDAAGDVTVIEADTGEVVYTYGPQRGSAEVTAVRPEGVVALRFDDGVVTLNGLAPDGAERWSREIDFRFRVRADHSPLVEHDTVVAIDGQRLVGIGLLDGDERWSTPLSANAPTVITSPTNDVVIVCVQRPDGLELSAHDMSTGELLWSNGFEGGQHGFLGVSRQQLVVVDRGPETGCDAPAVTTAAEGATFLDARTGAETWNLVGDDQVTLLYDEGRASGGQGPEMAAVATRRDDGSSAALLDPTTGVEQVRVEAETGWDPFFLRVIDGLAYGFALTPDGPIVFDPFDPQRRIGIDGGRVLGAGGGRLYAEADDELIAIR